MMGCVTMQGIRRIAAIAAIAAIAVSTTGLAGCSLLTPSLDQEIVNQTLVKLSTPAIQKKGILTVALDAADAPQSVRGTDGRIQGYAADVARALAKRLGLKVAFVDASSTDGLGSQGGGDIYLGASSDDASSSVAVLDAYLEDAPALFTKASSSAPAAASSASAASGATASASDAPRTTLTKEALAGATVGVQAGSAASDALSSSGISMEKKNYNNVNECLEALEKGEVQYVACDATAGAYLARTYADIDFAGIIGEVSAERIALRSSNADLSSAVEDAFNQISADGTLDAIHALWYGDMPLKLDNELVSGVALSDGSQASASQDAAAAGDANGENGSGAGTATVNGGGSAASTTAPAASTDANAATGADAGASTGTDAAASANSNADTAAAGNTDSANGL